MTYGDHICINVWHLRGVRQTRNKSCKDVSRGQTSRDPDIPIPSCFSVLKGDVHTTEVRAVMNVIESRHHRTEHDLRTAVVYQINHSGFNGALVHTHHLSMLLPCFSAIRKPNFP